MNIKSYAEVREQQRENRAAINAARERLKALAENLRPALDDTAEYENLDREIARREIIGKILQDNAAQAMAAELRPALADVLRQYDGKPYGPKTAEKICAALQERTGFVVWLSWNRYGDYCLIKARPYDVRPCDPVELETTHDAGRGLTADNRLHSVDGDPLKLRWHRPYIENPEERAAQILDAYRETQDAAAALEQKHNALRDLLPASMDCPYYARWNKTSLI